ncbi:MAG: DUF1349 domain-containing protein [Opitutaceae bacterium]|nr:DUF1349 domain-containing protein [Opitutaceae bacterium]
MNTPILLRLLLIITALFTSVAPARATIPAAAIADPRYALGYLVVTYYSGVDPTGTTDSRAGIQQAIDDAKINYLAVFFPAGTYLISDTLHCFNWQLWNPSLNPPGPNTPDLRAPALVGSKLGANRPVIKLIAGASGFGSPSVAKPMLAYRNFEAINSSGTAEVTLTNAFDTPANFMDRPSQLMNYNLRNLDFNCNGQAGAVGVTFAGAQDCSIQNVRVVATGAHAGFIGLGGTMGVANLEVEGGSYGVVLGDVPGAPSMGGDVPTIAGLRLYNQTVAAIVADCPSGQVQAVGFEIRPAAGGKSVQVSTVTRTIQGSFMLYDGIIDMTNNSGVLAIDNTPGKTANLRNVYIKNSTNLVKSGSQATVTGTGTWNRIVEYAYTDQASADADDPPYEQNDLRVNTYHLINGTLSRTVPSVQPLNDKQTNISAGSVPADLISRHLWQSLPSFEDGQYTNPLDTQHAGGATPELALSVFKAPHTLITGQADTAAFQAAIDAASSAGHGRVVVPRGVFHLSSPGLTLHANTILIGASIPVSVLAVHDSWRPTTGSPVLVQTDNNATATTFMGWLKLHIRRSGGGGTPDLYDRFSHVLWKAGRQSMTIASRVSQESTADMNSNPRTLMTFSGGGGGRHYGFGSPGRNTGGVGFRCLVFDGSTEPVWFYTCNVEASKSSPITATATNIEIKNSAANIRLIGLKREGTSPTAIITNSTNIGLFGHEDRGQIASSLGADIQILGTSNGVLVAAAGMRSVANAPTSGTKVIFEAITGQGLAYPEALSVYKRGTLDEAAVYIAPTGGGLPSPWVTADVGAVGATGSASFNSGNATFTVVGSGADIWGTADAFRYVHQSWTGDATAIVKVETLQNTNNFAKAGLMIRQSLAADSAHATINLTPPTGPNGVEFIRRTTAGGTSTNNFAPGVSAPRWLKLVRTGNSFSAFHSSDGSAWTQLGTAQSITMTGPVFVGFVVCSHVAGTLNTSTFTNVNVTGGDTTAPSVPTGLAASSITETSFTLSWTASTDDVGVTGYEVFKDGVSVGTPSGTTFNVTGLTGGITYAMTVRARDAVPNWSAQSTALNVTTNLGLFTANQDIGSPALAGSASLSAGVYTVTGAGTDIWGTADQFRFVHESWTGDGRIVAKVLTVQNTHANAKGGVMFREDTTTGARNANLVVNATAGIQLTHRATTGGTTTSDAISTGFGAPYWLRLERHGNVFTGWQSPDGTSWFLTGATPSFTVNAATRVGLIANSHNAAALSTSTFDNVSVTNVPAWTAADIGTVGAAGNTSVNYTTDVFTLNGSGANIYTTADSFHFNYLTWTANDATIIAEITGVENTHNNAKAGLMIRQSDTAAGSAHATIVLTPGTNGIEFLRRTALNGTTANTFTGTVTAPPRWLKLVRSGNSFSAFHSSDGGTWTQLGTAETITMTGTVFVGLVSCSIINTTNLCTGTFESVYVK